jgi:competence protein ComFC
MIPPASRLKQEFSNLSGRLLDLLFPPRCVNCKKPNQVLCKTCFDSIRLITTPICQRCGHPLRTVRAACPECRAHPLTITMIRAAAWHEGAIREAIHALKYLRRRDVAAPLASLLSSALPPADLPIDFITSVPLFPLREQERGYNQAELLAIQVARQVRLPYEAVLARTRATADQIGLDGRARRVNVADAFAATTRSLNNKAVLLIDDVCTTGATLDACALALFQEGARAVYGLTVARPRSLV